MDLEKEFKLNLDVAQEENPEMDLNERVKLATEWTLEEAQRQIAQVAEHHWAGHLENVAQFSDHEYRKYPH